VQFPTALDLVLDALERMRETTSRLPCASRAALDELIARGANVAAYDEPTPRPKAAFVAEAVAGVAGKIERLAALQATVAVCLKCPNLAGSRTQTVFGIGDPDAEVMFVGEAPGADED
jgi:DNA polymerase